MPANWPARTIAPRIRALLALGSIFLELGLVACLNGRPAISSPRFDRVVSNIMDQALVPGLCLTVLDHGRIGPTRVLGLKSQSTREPVTESTIFEACSLSKPVFAYAVLSLIGEGRLELDRPLVAYAPREYLQREFFHGPISDERIERITARMVLSHRTGFPNWREETTLPLLFDPGAEYGYSGEGYIFLQTVVEYLTGLPAQDLIKQKVFDPLGLRDSSFVWQDDFEARAASPHSSSGEVRPNRKRTRAGVAGSLYATSQDYARFLLALLDGPGLVQELRAEMLSKQTPVSIGIDWGLGVGLESVGGAEYIWHWGDNPGFKSLFLVSRKERSGFVYFCNGDSGLSFAPDLSRLLVGAGHPIFDSNLLARYRAPESSYPQTSKAPTTKPGVPQENES